MMLMIMRCMMQFAGGGNYIIINPCFCLILKQKNGCTKNTVTLEQSSYRLNLVLLSTTLSNHFKKAILQLSHIHFTHLTHPKLSKIVILLFLQIKQPLNHPSSSGSLTSLTNRPLGLSTAFDVVNIKLILKRLRIIGLPSDVINIILLWIGPRDHISYGGLLV